MKSSIEELSKEKGSLENKVAEPGMQKTIVGGKAKHYVTQVVALETHKASLEVSLKAAMEQKTDIEPLKKHVLALRSKIHQMQLQMAEEMLKFQQVETRLEEIVSIASYFLDRTQDILEILQGRLTWLETTKEPPDNAPIKDIETMKLEYELIEFGSKATEELVMAIRRTKGVCA